MRYSRIAFEVEAVPYELGKGIEDGFELWSDIVTHGWINTDYLIKVKKENGSIACPYINIRRGRAFIEDGDYIITEADGSRHVCNGGSFVSRYHSVP